MWHKTIILSLGNVNQIDLFCPAIQTAPTGLTDL